MISDNLDKVKARIEKAEQEAARPAGRVRLLAVSKTFDADAVRQAHAAGQRAFGENYVQEGVQKILDTAELPGMEWHMIGPIQSNKTRDVAAHFDWVHSLDRERIAMRLSEQRPAHLPPLNVCIQVNIDDGANKSGLAPEEALGLARQVAQMPHLHLRGLMVIPEPAINLEASRAIFERARALFDSLKLEFPGLDCLSMGMSADLEAAVLAGSTMVRVGTAIFGVR